MGRGAQFLGSVKNCTVDLHVTIVRPQEGVPSRLFGHCIASLEDYLATMGRGATNQTELAKETVAAHFAEFSTETAIQAQNLEQQNVRLTDNREVNTLLEG